MWEEKKNNKHLTQTNRKKNLFYFQISRQRQDKGSSIAFLFLGLNGVYLKITNIIIFYHKEEKMDCPWQLGKDLESTGKGLQSQIQNGLQSFLGSQDNLFAESNSNRLLNNSSYEWDYYKQSKQVEPFPLPEFDPISEEKNFFLQTNLSKELFNIEEEIMKEQLPKERKKNGNVPKFICRTTFYKFSKYKKIFKDEPKLLKEMTTQGYQQRKKYFRNKNANNTLKDVRRIFVDCDGSSNPRKRSFLMRKMLNSILRSSLKEEVIYNEQIQLKKEYLISLKTQALRCRNSSLMCRLKSR